MALSSFKFKNNTRLQNAAKNRPPIKLGEIGPGVQLLQEVLVALGYPLPKSTKPEGTMDGIYGVETKGAILAFQGNHSLVTDGSTGENTLKQIDILLPYTNIPIKPDPKLKSSSSVPPKITHECRLHLRVTAGAEYLKEVSDTPEVLIQYMSVEFRKAKVLFGLNGIRLTLVTLERVRAPEIDNLLFEVQTDCGLIPEANLKLLYRLGTIVPPNEIVGYFVYRMFSPGGQRYVQGCSAHAPNRPAFAVAMNDIFPYNALAHELGHVLLGYSYLPHHHADPKNLMFGAGTLEMQPVLDDSQLAQMRRSPYLKKIA